MKKTVVAIVGPTAVGKTKLSIKLAKKFNGEIINGDSMQVYKGMDIGTAKIKREEMHGIPHHMLDIREPNEDFSVVQFQTEVQKHIEEINLNRKTPILVGGSGLYIQAILYNYNFSDQKRDPIFTNKLEKINEEKGRHFLHNQLKKIDPQQAKAIHQNNVRRVIRALEIYETTGKTMSEYEKEQNKESPYNFIIIGLTMERDILYSRINKRVDLMIEEGLVDEVKTLYEKGLQNCQSMKAIGYKEFIPYFEKEQSLEHSIQLLKRNSRRYAKRQYTWFKNKMPVHWNSVNEGGNIDHIETIFKKIAGILPDK